jgi:hypothetical protein
MFSFSCLLRFYVLLFYCVCGVCAPKTSPAVVLSRTFSSLQASFHNNKGSSPVFIPPDDDFPLSIRAPCPSNRARFGSACVSICPKPLVMQLFPQASGGNMCVPEYRCENGLKVSSIPPNQLFDNTMILITSCLFSKFSYIRRLGASQA